MQPLKINYYKDYIGRGKMLRIEWQVQKTKCKTVNTL